MWPIQEVTLPLPGAVSLLCGDSSIPFEYIRAGWQVLAKIGLLAGSVDLDQSVALQFYLADLGPETQLFINNPNSTTWPASYY